MSSLSTWFSEVRGVWKAAILIIAIFGAGLTTGAAAGGFTKLPQRIVALEQQANQLDDRLDDLARDVAAIRKANQQTLCLTIAERQHSDWRKCI